MIDTDLPASWESAGVGIERWTTCSKHSSKKLRAEIQKVGRKSDKLMMETRWYPLVVSSALFFGMAAIIKIFF